MKRQNITDCLKKIEKSDLDPQTKDDIKFYFNGLYSVFDYFSEADIGYDKDREYYYIDNDGCSSNEKLAKFLLTWYYSID